MENLQKENEKVEQIKLQEIENLKYKFNTQMEQLKKDYENHLNNIRNQLINMKKYNPNNDYEYQQQEKQFELQKMQLIELYNKKLIDLQNDFIKNKTLLENESNKYNQMIENKKIINNFETNKKIEEVLT